MHDKTTDSQLYAIHTDHLGTPQLVTDAQQHPVWQASYTAFGKAKVSTEKIMLNLRLPGQYFDVETDKHYNLHRDYDPLVGRYLTSDPIGLDGGHNTYSYVGGNPLSRIDPLGLKGVMPGGRWWDPPVVDNGSSCKTTALPLTQVDDDGCISTGAGPKICIGPGAIKGVATNLAEQLALEAAQSGAGQRIMQGLINDARYPESVWAKMQYIQTSLTTGENIVIHYWQNLVTGVREGFKFK
ncbi:MAG: hypothetical protein GZ090_02515 [Oxalobacteraceae bacterium]|nr:hypothetical protein [Oxalobacteraceae bacterium]